VNEAIERARISALTHLGKRPQDPAQS